MGILKIVTLVILMISFRASAESLIVYGDDVYAPVIHTDRGKPAGLLPAILKRLERDTGDIYELRLAPWKRAYESSLSGDGGILGVSHTKERAALFDFSKPIYDDDIQVVMLRESAFPFKGLQDLKGKTLGGVQGASYGDEVDRAIVAGLFKVDRDVGQIGRLRKLLAGRLDAALVGNGLAGFDFILNSDEVLRSSRQRFVIAQTPLVRDPLHLAFPKKMLKAEVLARFDAALVRLQRSAEWKTLLLGAMTTAPASK